MKVRLLGTCALASDTGNYSQATAYSVRDRLLESWNDNQQFYRDNDSKRVYYLSMEFLMGMTQANLI